MEQDEVRKLVKLAKALNDDIYYNQFAEYLNITNHSFYNRLNGYYRLSREKLYKLLDIVIDLAED